MSFLNFRIELWRSLSLCLIKWHFVRGENHDDPFSISYGEGNQDFCLFSFIYLTV